MYRGERKIKKKEKEERKDKKEGRNEGERGRTNGVDETVVRSKWREKIAGERKGREVGLEPGFYRLRKCQTPVE